MVPLSLNPVCSVSAVQDRGRCTLACVGTPELRSASHVCHCKSFGNQRSFCPFLHLPFLSICLSSSPDTRLQPRSQQPPWEWQLPAIRQTAASQPLTAASQLPKLLTASQLHTGSIRSWPSTSGSLSVIYIWQFPSDSLLVFSCMYSYKHALPERFAGILNRPNAHIASPQSWFQTS